MAPRPCSIPVSVAMLLAGSACTSYDPSLPPIAFYCGGTDPKCPDGYACKSNGPGNPVCIKQQDPDAGNTCGAFSGPLARWSFSGAPGSQTSTLGIPNAVDVAPAALERAPVLVAEPGADSINASNWPLTTQLDRSRYYTLSMSALPGCSLRLTSISVDAISSTTGPASAALATSADAFAQTTPLSTTVPTTPALALGIASGSVRSRIYAYGATASTGTLRLRNSLTISGEVR